MTLTTNKSREVSHGHQAHGTSNPSHSAEVPHFTDNAFSPRTPNFELTVPQEAAGELATQDDYVPSKNGTEASALFQSDPSSTVPESIPINLEEALECTDAKSTELLWGVLEEMQDTSTRKERIAMSAVEACF